MFTGAMSESSQTEVTIRDVDETAMDILIDFCYTSSIVVEENNVQIQNMMMSKYIAFFLTEVSAWQKTLSTVDLVISR